MCVGVCACVRVRVEQRGQRDDGLWVGFLSWRAKKMCTHRHTLYLMPGAVWEIFIVSGRCLRAIEKAKVYYFLGFVIFFILSSSLILSHCHRF